MDTRSGRGKNSARSAPPPVIDTSGETLDLGRILVRRTPVGYFCVGIGDATTLLRFAFDADDNRDRSPFGAACRRLEKAVEGGGVAKARRLGLKIPLGEIGDPQLRRLAIAAALLKAGFDPEQARDDHGRWTGGGGTNDAAALDGVAAGAATVADYGPTRANWSAWGRAALDLLPRVAARAAGPLAMVGGLFLMPKSAGAVADGALPGWPNVAYHLNEMDLHLFHVDDQGNRTEFFVTHYDSDNFYRDDHGNVVAYNADGALVVDPAAIAAVMPAAAGAKAKEEETEEERKARIAELVAQARAKVRAADPEELCPDPQADRRGSESASPRAKAYQQQVTQLPYGVAFYLDGVNFDGCRFWGDKNMLESKAQGFEQHLSPDGGWAPYWEGFQGDIIQMTAQSAAAARYGKFVEWHVAEQPVAEVLRVYAESHFSNLRVIWVPALPLPSEKGMSPLPPLSQDFVLKLRQMTAVSANEQWIRLDPDGLRFVPALGTRT